MSALTFALRARPDRDVDLSGLVPDRLAGLNRATIAAMRLPGGEKISDLFEVAGDDAGNIVILNSTPRLTHVGAGMRSGVMTVEGDCGTHAGLAMRGGNLIVRGDAGDFAGAEVPGERQGMRGGIIAISGHAGDRLGERMRRGLILAGSAGACCGVNMLAGTIIVAGEVGPMAGFNLKRGSLILGRRPKALPATFQDSGVHTLLFMTLLSRALHREAGMFAPLPALGRPVQRYCGDLACGGTGEILVLA